MTLFCRSALLLRTALLLAGVVFGLELRAESPVRLLTGDEMRRELAAVPPRAIILNALPRSNRTTLVCVIYVPDEGIRALVALDLKSRMPRAMVAMRDGWTASQRFDHPIKWAEDSCLFRVRKNRDDNESEGPCYRWNVATVELRETGPLTGDEGTDFVVGAFSQGAARNGLECVWRRPTAADLPGTIELVRPDDGSFVGKVPLSTTAQTLSLAYCAPGVAVIVHRPQWPQPDSEFEVKATAVDDGRTLWRMTQADLNESFEGKVYLVKMALGYITSPDVIPCYVQRRVGREFGMVLRTLDVRRGTWLPEISPIPSYALPRSSANGRVVVVSDRNLNQDIVTEYRRDDAITVTRIEAANKELGTAHVVLPDGVVLLSGDARRLELLSPFTALSKPTVLIDLDDLPAAKTDD